MSVTNRRVVSQDGADFYPTPTWATQALVDREGFSGPIWEPACGDGAMAGVLGRTGNKIYASDLNDYGYGDSWVDFLRNEAPPIANIITSPPFNLAEMFLDRALEIATGKVAFLLRLAFLESAGRADRVFLRPTRRPTRVWVFSERITFYPRGVQTGGSGTTAYAWFVWDRAETGRETRLQWLPPGCKQKARPNRKEPCVFRPR